MGAPLGNCNACKHKTGINNRSKIPKTYNEIVYESRMRKLRATYRDRQALSRFSRPYLRNRYR